MWASAGFVLLSLTLASPEPLADDVFERAAGMAPSVQFATDAQGLQQKLQHTTQMMKQFPDKSTEPQKAFTWDELAQHDGNQLPCYLAIDNFVYDFQEFIQYHPPGPETIKKYAGQDASAAVKGSGMPEQLYRPFLHKFQVGYIVSSERDNSTGSAAVAKAVKARL